jgi:hypothetical protein
LTKVQTRISAPKRWWQKHGTDKKNAQGYAVSMDSQPAELTNTNTIKTHKTNGQELAQDDLNMA